MTNFIYVITSIYFDATVSSGSHIKRSRTVGYYFELDKAQRCVEEDWAHFDEMGYYNYIVIEKTHQGIYPGGFEDNTEYWYKHDYDTTGKWFPTQKPEVLKGMISFGIG